MTVYQALGIAVILWALWFAWAYRDVIGGWML